MREPSIIVNGLAELVRQVLPLLVVVGLVQLTPEKLAGWVSIISFVLAFISSFILRSQVTPNATADAQIIVAKDKPDLMIETIKSEAKRELANAA